MPRRLVDRMTKTSGRPCERLRLLAATRSQDQTPRGLRKPWHSAAVRGSDGCIRAETSSLRGNMLGRSDSDRSLVRSRAGPPPYGTPPEARRARLPSTAFAALQVSSPRMAASPFLHRNLERTFAGAARTPAAPLARAAHHLRPRLSLPFGFGQSRSPGWSCLALDVAVGRARSLGRALRCGRHRPQARRSCGQTSDLRVLTGK